nr:tetratricopeptide repeat protein [Leptolyngbya sp. FACHB-36]
MGVLRGDPLHSLPELEALSGTSGTIDPRSAGLGALGRQLYNSLFQGTMRESWIMARGIAQNRQERLRLRLGLKDTRLPRLPWEVLHGGDRLIATGTDVLFSRYHSGVSVLSSLGALNSPQASDQPIRILMVLAAPTDQAALALKQEAQHLQDELQSFRRSGSGGGQVINLELTILEQPGREQLAQALEHNHYQVFHYAGHSDLGTSGGSLYLVSRKTGLTEALSGDDLAGLLVNNGIRVAVFNSCRGGYTATADPADGQSNLVEALVKRGIPAVLAMAERIPDDVALNLSRLFYRNLKQAYPIDLSLSRARQGLIASYTSRQLYWALPVLYLHPEFDGYLQSLNLDLSDRPENLLIDEVEDDAILSARSAALDDPFIEADFDDYLDDDYGEPFDADDPEADPDYETDAATIAQMIDQLTRSTPVVERPLPAPPGEDLLPDRDDARPSYPILAENPRYSPPLVPTTPPTRPVSNAEASAIAVANGGAGMSSDLEQMLADAGKLTEAIAVCNQAIQRNPHDATAYHRLGLALADQGYVSEAIEVYHQALQLDPQAAEAHNSLGLALYQQGNLSSAIHAFNRAIQLDPSLTDAYHNLGRAMHKQGDSTPSRTGTIAPTPIIAQAADVKTPKPPRRSVHWRGLRQLPLRWIGAGTIGAALLLLGGWVAYNQLTRPAIEVRFSGPSPDAAGNQGDLRQVSTGVVANLAAEQLNKGNIPAARPAVEALLQRGALTQAIAALTPSLGKQPDDPTLNFWMGRAAWQSAKTGNRDYTAQDARRFWETSAKRQPNPLVQNALGFAYYEEGEIDRAGRAWFRALQLLGEQGAAPNGAGRATTPAPVDALTAYAGIALTMTKSAANQTPSRRAMLLSEATRLRQKVMTDDPVAFAPDALSQNWLWSEKSIKDWRSLQALK